MVLRLIIRLNIFEMTPPFVPLYDQHDKQTSTISKRKTKSKLKYNFSWIRSPQLYGRRGLQCRWWHVALWCECRKSMTQRDEATTLLPFHEGFERMGLAHCIMRHSIWCYHFIKIGDQITCQFNASFIEITCKTSPFFRFFTLKNMQNFSSIAHAVFLKKKLTIE